MTYNRQKYCEDDFFKFRVNYDETICRECGRDVVNVHTVQSVVCREKIYITCNGLSEDECFNVHRFGIILDVLMQCVRGRTNT